MVALFCYNETMTENQCAILKKAENLVEEILANEPSGHDWWHIVRVRNLAREIGEQEHANLFICELAALLHDLADEKISGSKHIGLAAVKSWLQENQVSQADREHILEIIQWLSFKGGSQPSQTLTLEGQIVQDADRLDAIGAVGIARVFAYSGAKGRLIHDPNKLPREDFTLEEYRNGQETAIMHFYEKLLRLKDLMNTSHAKKLAAASHAYMETYLEQFYQEWGGHR